MHRRLHKTILDYIVIAIIPILIMLLTGSLAMFLVTAFYHGAHDLRLRWILGLFVLASVLIARISIVQGKQHAFLFGLALALATAMAILKFLNSDWALAISCLGLIWWATHQLTWDCTLIDETEDASGDGLMQKIGCDQNLLRDDPNAIMSVNKPRPDEGQVAGKSVAAGIPGHQVGQRAAHAPGMWVIYFSLGALPVFAVGQWWLPDLASSAQQDIILSIVVYIASALGLLVSTSFLGLRRYLRQRNVEMPLQIAQVWLISGFSVIGIILVLAWVLPRPQLGRAITTTARRLTSPDDLKPARWALGTDAPKGSPSEPEARSFEFDPEQDSAAEGQQKSVSDAPARDAKPNNGPPAAKNSSRKTPGSSESRPEEEPRETNGGANAKSPAQTDSRSDRVGGASEDAAKSFEKPNRAGAGGKTESSSEGEPAQEKEAAASGRAEETQSKDSPAATPPHAQAASSTNRGRSRDDPEMTEDQTAVERGGSNDGRRSSGEPDSLDETSTGSADQGPRPSPNRPLDFKNSLRNLGSWAKIIFQAFVLLGGLFLAWRYRGLFYRNWKEFLLELRKWWGRLFATKERADSKPTTGTDYSVAQVRPFASFSNPFEVQGRMKREPNELVRYSFAAVEAWALEQGCPRQEHETPLEFAVSLRRHEPAFGATVSGLADFYSRYAYGGDRLERVDLDGLRELWRVLASAHRYS